MAEPISFVMVAVTGVEDESAIEAAIENLRNAEQDFEVVDIKTTTREDVDLLGGPVIYFP